MTGTERWVHGERIGEFLVRIGVMRSWMVQAVLAVQRDGDRRSFGEIAIERGYIDDLALRRYADAHAQAAAVPRRREVNLTSRGNP